MILMQFVAEGGEKVKVESLDVGKDLGKVRLLVDHGPAGFSSFIVPAGVVMGLATALVVQESVHLRAENADLRQQVNGHCERIAAQSELLSRRAEKPVTSLAAGV